MVYLDEATMLQELPHRSVRENHLTYYEELKRHQPFRARRYAWGRALASACVYAFALLILTKLGLRLTESIALQSYAWSHLLTDVPTLLLLLTALIVPLRGLRRAAAALGERSFGLSFYHYTLTLPLRRLRAKFSRWVHRHEFVRPALPAAE